MGREDYLTQVIRNLESDKEVLIDILRTQLLCPRRSGVEGYSDICECNKHCTCFLCDKAYEECWAELVERKRPPEKYNTH